MPGERIEGMRPISRYNTFNNRGVLVSSKRVPSNVVASYAPGVVVGTIIYNELLWTSDFSNVVWDNTATVTTSLEEAPNRSYTSFLVSPPLPGDYISQEVGSYLNTQTLYLSVWLKSETTFSDVRIRITTDLSQVSYLDCDVTDFWENFSTSLTLTADSVVSVDFLFNQNNTYIYGPMLTTTPWSMFINSEGTKGSYTKIGT